MMQTAKAELNIGIRIGFPYITGVHFGYSPSVGAAGFGVRGNLETTFLAVNRIAASGVYYLPVSENGNSIYFGVGAGFSTQLVGQTYVCPPKPEYCAPPMSLIPPLAPEIHALVGFNWQLSPNLGLFAEFSEVFWLTKYSGITTIGWPLTYLGLNFEL